MSEDFLIKARWVVPVEPAGTVLEQHAVAVRGGKIEAVLPGHEAEARYPGLQTFELPSHAVIPGLVNAHTHAAMTLMRGLADDLAGGPETVDPGQLELAVELITDAEQWAGFDEAYRQRMLSHIVGFEITTARIEAKFKLSQNRTKEEQSNVIASLAKAGDTAVSGVSRLMQEQGLGKVTQE